MEADKRALRREILAVRDGLGKDERIRKSSLIRERLLTHPAFLQADCILSYVNYGSEVQTRTLLEICLRDGKPVYCPRVRGKEMDFYGIDSVSELEAGFHGIWETPEREERLYRPRKGTLMIMPGVVFDRYRHRIGYGGGYYDRYLHGREDIVTVALAFSVQIRENIPSGPHDIRPRIILTECGEIT